MLLRHEYFVTEMKEVANAPHTLSTPWSSEKSAY